MAKGGEFRERAIKGAALMGAGAVATLVLQHTTNGNHYEDAMVRETASYMSGHSFERSEFRWERQQHPNAASVDAAATQGYQNLEGAQPGHESHRAHAVVLCGFVGANALNGQPGHEGQQVVIDWTAAQTIANGANPKVEQLDAAYDKVAGDCQSELTHAIDTHVAELDFPVMANH